MRVRESPQFTSGGAGGFQERQNIFDCPPGGGGAKLNFGLRSEGGRKKTLLKRGIYMTEVSIIKVKKHLFEYMI